jgi:hypothetical protein
MLDTSTKVTAYCLVEEQTYTDEEGRKIGLGIPNPPSEPSGAVPDTAVNPRQWSCNKMEPTQ